MDVKAIQAALKEKGVDGWLFYVDPESFVNRKRARRRRTKQQTPSPVSQLRLFDLA